MKHLDDLLRQHLGEQIALEEHLCRVLDQQIAEVSENDFADARDLLIRTRETLERHYTPLNDLLGKLEQESLSSTAASIGKNGAVHGDRDRVSEQRRRISNILRDDYSALNHITISNTLLHTAALALGSEEIAVTALSHLKNLTPLVMQIAHLMPEIVTRELYKESSMIDLSIAQIALRNTQTAWRLS